MTTYSRRAWLAASEAWSDFSSEWEPYRRLAAHRGFIFPPSGDRWYDSWDAPGASQRALLERAIADTPTTLREAIAASSSWAETLARVLAWRDDVRRRGAA